MAKQSTFFVSAVVPLHNQAALLPAFLDELHQTLNSHYLHYEILLIDDGSTDGTESLVQAQLSKVPCIRYITLSRPFGLETAIACGLDTAIGDVIVTINPATDPVDQLPAFVDAVKQGNGVVFGLITNQQDISFGTRVARRLFRFMSRSVLTFALPPDNASRYTAMSRQAINAILSIKDKSRFIKVFGSQIGYKVAYIDYKATWRQAPPQQRRFIEQVEDGLNILVMNSTRPLRYASYVGLLASFINLGYIFYVFLINIIKQDVAEGWTTQSLQSSIMWFLLFAILTIMLEYIGRLLVESRNRPNYYVRGEHTSSVMILDQDRRNVTTQAG